MTEMGVKYLTYLEGRRSNIAREIETHRSNVATEAETHRSNFARELEATRSNVAKELEATRSNVAREIETNRSNLAKERNTRYDLAISSIDDELKAVKTELSNLSKQMDATAAKYAETFVKQMQSGNSIIGAGTTFSQAITALFGQDTASSILKNSAYAEEIEKYYNLLVREEQLQTRKDSILEELS